MMSYSSKQSGERFVALDLHKSYAVVGAVDRQQQVVLPPRRVPLQRLAGWAEKHLGPTDVAVLEAGANAWSVHDLLERLVDKVTVVHPYHVKLIASSMVKTDRIDTLILARLLAADILPSIWVPPTHVRELRSLVSHRRRLVKQRSAAKNRLHSILHRHSIAPAPGDLFSASNRGWWDSLSTPSSEKLRARQDLSIIDHLNVLIVEVEAELAQLSQSVYWGDQVAFLVQLPGIGMLSAMTILGAIGDVARFPNAKKLVGYSGLGARVHHSGSSRRGGGITKQGRRELRTVMVESAWVAVRRHHHWQAQFARLAKRIGKQKAIVAIARKLLVVVWHVLTKQVVDRHAEVPAVARSLMDWGAGHRLATGLGMSRAQFVRQALDKLGAGDNLTDIKYCGRTYNLPDKVPKVTPA
jgi:transposase